MLAVIGFVLVAMETMPAGLLPVIATGLDTSEGTVGLFVSAYALGTDEGGGGKRSRSTGCADGRSARHVWRR